MLAAEVHVDQPFVDLMHAVLQAGGDAQLVALDRQDQRRLHLERDLDVVELHQAAQRGDDDRARPGQAHLARDRGLVADGEVPVVQRHAGARQYSTNRLMVALTSRMPP